ncbi:MAG: hypothetical protein J6Y08_04655 [Clostridiales bacterium]|nr:hypothetical protein [Clostridiales bacterium]
MSDDNRKKRIIMIVVCVFVGGMLLWDIADTLSGGSHIVRRAILAVFNLIFRLL